MRESFKRLLAACAVAFCLALACFLVFSAPAFAQSTFGTVTGTITDSSGAAIPGTQVTLTNTATATKVMQITGSDGLYTFVNVIPGDYRLDAEKSGFKHFTRDPVVVQVQQDVRIDVPLEVGAVSQTIEVTSAT
ncbi:MAG: carboxypeptidase-like regulatory domain-containing protein, partial [Candidatus Acidiferrales bacterium]